MYVNALLHFELKLQILKQKKLKSQMANKSFKIGPLGVCMQLDLYCKTFLNVFERTEIFLVSIEFRFRVFFLISRSTSFHKPILRFCLAKHKYRMQLSENYFQGEMRKLLTMIWHTTSRIASKTPTLDMAIGCVWLDLFIDNSETLTPRTQIQHRGILVSFMERKGIKNRIATINIKVL